MVFYPNWMYIIYIYYYNSYTCSFSHSLFYISLNDCVFCILINGLYFLWLFFLLLVIGKAHGLSFVVYKPIFRTKGLQYVWEGLESLLLRAHFLKAGVFHKLIEEFPWHSPASAGETMTLGHEFPMLSTTHCTFMCPLCPMPAWHRTVIAKYVQKSGEDWNMGTA